LVAKWDAQNAKVVLYTNERSWIEVYCDFEPTAEMVTAITSLSSVIDNAIAKHQEKEVLNKLMENYGWKTGPGKKALTNGGV
jgi:hypothetical protein